MKHELKIWPNYFADVARETKNFEFRRNDRGFSVGDTLLFREWDPETREYTGRQLWRRVRYIQEKVDGLDPTGYCIMAIVPALPSREELGTMNDRSDYVRGLVQGYALGWRDCRRAYNQERTLLDAVDGDGLGVPGDPPAVDDQD